MTFNYMLKSRKYRFLNHFSKCLVIKYSKAKKLYFNEQLNMAQRESVFHWKQLWTEALNRKEAIQIQSVSCGLKANAQKLYSTSAST